MASSAGKGVITLDDIATGVTYNKQPYIEGERFEIVTPDAISQQRFYKIENYTHRYLKKEKRSPFVEYRQKIPLREGFNSNTMPVLKHVASQDSIAALPFKPNQTAQPMAPSIILYQDTVPTQISPEPQPNSMPMPGAVLKKKVTINTHHKAQSKGDVYHPRELYSPQGEKPELAFRKANPYKGTKYHNMLSTLHMERDSTLRDVLQKSHEVSKGLQRTLKQQTSQAYLESQMLPPLPRSRGEPVLAQVRLAKNGYKKAGNTAHTKITNGGYSRTNYGGFFMN